MYIHPMYVCTNISLYHGMYICGVMRYQEKYPCVMSGLLDREGRGVSVVVCVIG